MSRLLGFRLSFSAYRQFPNDSTVAFYELYCQISDFVVEEMNVHVLALCLIQLYVIATLN